MSGLDAKLQALARVTVLAAVLLSPWLFGSSEPWAYLLICYLVGIGVAAWLGSLVCAEEARVRAPLLVLALAALLGFVAFQMVALPRPFVETVSPVAAEAQGAHRELFARIGVAEFVGSPGGADGRTATLSASPAATAASLGLLAAYVGAFLVLANTFTDWRQLRRAAAAVVASSLAMVVVALAQHFSGAEAIYWLHKPRFGGSLFGPFTNRNHFAAHLNMALGVALGLLLLTLASREKRVAPTWRARLSWLAGPAGSQVALLGFAALLMAATVFVTLSRGGMLSLVVALGAVAAALVASRAKPGLGPVLGVLALLAVLAVGWLAGRPVVERLASLGDVARTLPDNARVHATADTLRIFEAAPLLGCGFGTFRHVFPLFQGEATLAGRWLHAHNDYAQLLAEGGAAGALLVGLVGLAFAWAVGRRLRKVSSRTRWFVGGLAVGLVAIVLHSLVDYSLHKPANAFFLAAVGGLMLAAAHLSARSHAPRAWTTLVRLGAVAGLAALAVLALCDGGRYRGALASARFQQLARLVEATADPAARARAVEQAAAEGERVVRFARRDADPLCEVAAACLAWAREDGLDLPTRLRLGEQAVRASALAVQAAPSDYEPWLLLARAHAGVGLQPQARLCTKRARYLAPPDVRAELPLDDSASAEAAPGRVAQREKKHDDPGS